ncbi:MAG: hypothetical protein ACJ8FU_08290 [Xanthobacteraceae bacterium]
MVLQAEFGEPFRGKYASAEQFVWRGRVRIAFFRIHPSGRELVCVFLTHYRAGQKLPRR